MSKADKKTVEQIAAEVDGISVDRLSAALGALRAFESETGDWICERQAEAEDNGEDLEEDDAYYAAYDNFCAKLSDELVAEYKTSSYDMGLMMEVSGGDWQQIAGAMKDSTKGDLVIDVCTRL